MTPKQRVLKKWPLAVCEFVGPEYYFVSAYRGAPDSISFGHHTPAAAWADAARRLERKRG